MQRKPILYTRVSTDEQREQGFSLQDQEARLRKYCQIEGFQIVRHYQEDHSAKDFNRPVFNQMLSDLREKRIKADLLLCVRIDRFSRNMLESILMFQTLKKLGVEFRVIEGGNFDLDTPENLIPHMINLLLPQVENERRGLNTKRGMRQAMREGRWVSSPPKGYSLIRENGISLLYPNDEAKYMREAFELYAKGIYSQEEVRKIIWDKGCKCQRNGFNKILRNPAYIGKIKIKAWRDEEEEIVDGLHEAIIDETTFDKVQSIITGRKRGKLNKTKLNDNLPLRGLLICKECGGNLTGSPSRSHTGTRYYYYHCNTKGCKERFRSDEASMMFIQFLNSFKIPDEVFDLYYHIMKDLFKKDDQQRESEKLALEKQIKALDTQIEKVEDKSLYTNAKERYEGKITELKIKFQDIDLQKTNYMKYVEYDFSLLRNLKEFYMQAETRLKQQIVSSIFPDKLIYDDRKYRTPKVNQVLELLTSNINELGEIKKGKKSISENLSSLASPRGIEPLLQE